jgi:hypothetical protein
MNANGWGAIVVAAALFLAGCDGFVRVRGRVVDATGTPMSSAQVRLDAGPDQRAFAESVRADGCFVLSRVVAPGRYKYTFRVTAPGFAPAEATLATLDDNYALVMLHPLAHGKQGSVSVSVGASAGVPRVPQCDFAACRGC